MVYLFWHKQIWDVRPGFRFLDGDAFEIKVIDTTPAPGFLVALAKRRQFVLGRAVHAEHVPTVMELQGRPERLDDLNTPDGFPCISPRFKAIIDELDPGAHQFFPLKVVNRRGEHFADRWLWVICNLIDSVDREHTNLDFRNQTMWDWDSVPNPKVVYNAAQIGSCHFWRDRYLMPGNMQCSDLAAQMIIENKLIAVALAEQETV